jgi:hypothetical protein
VKSKRIKRILTPYYIPRPVKTDNIIEIDEFFSGFAPGEFVHGSSMLPTSRWNSFIVELWLIHHAIRRENI